MPTPERFLAVLKEQRIKHSLEALNPGKGDQTEFGYGKAVGISQGLELAERMWEQQISEEEREIGSNVGTSKR